MYPNIDRALFEIKVVRASVMRAEGKVDLHDISRELAYRTRMVWRFSQTAAASAGDGLVDRARGILGFASDARHKVLAYY